MAKLLRRGRVAVVLAACLSLPSGTAQAADPLDFTAATIVNAGDQFAANAEYSFYATDSGDRFSNVTCDQPKAYPYETQKYQNLLIGSLRQHDTVLGEAHCFSFAPQSYTCRLRMDVDYFHRTGLASGTWYYTGYSLDVTAYAFGGACDAPGILDVIYPDTHVAVNKPRRVRAYVYTSLTGTAPVARYVSQTYGV